ncbi:MAG: DEAD/DEAH box helicase [Bacteroidales bacterium]|nr:DEAD/DEAH box helicase [Bacteroidales bacterium]
MNTSVVDKDTIRTIDFAELDAYSRRQSYNRKLRPYQQENKSAIYRAWAEGKMGVMLQMPTGTGKTHLFSSIIKDLQDYFYDKGSACSKKDIDERLKWNIPKILVLVHRVELLEQIEDTLTSKYKHVCGTISGGKVFGSSRNVIVASVQTLSRRRRLTQWEQDTNFDFIIIDEAHHSPADSYQRIRQAWPNARLLGVTATPCRLNHQPFTDTYDKLILSQPVYRFIEQNYLCNYEYFSIRPDSQMQYKIDHLKTDFSGDYDELEMERLLNQDRIRAGILETYERFAKGKKGIVYTINRKHNEMLATLFSQHGYRVAYIDSLTPKEERNSAVKEFRKGEIDIIFNVNIFSEGFDCPDVEFIQLCRPTKSLSMYLQQVGRGFRIAWGKEKVLFLDNVGLYNRFGLPSARRHWQHHFEGREDWDETGTCGGGLLEEHQYVPRDLSEGNEEMQMVYTSIEAPETYQPVANAQADDIDEPIAEKKPIENIKHNMEEEIIVLTDDDSININTATDEEVAHLLLMIENKHPTGVIKTESIEEWLTMQHNERMLTLIDNVVSQGFSREEIIALLSELAPAETSMTVKESEIPFEGLYVRKKDGTIIQEKKGIDTFIRAIRDAGVENVFKAKIATLGRYLVSDAPHPSYPNRSFFYDGYYIVVNHACVQKKKLLEEINKTLQLGWEIGIK